MPHIRLSLSSNVVPNDVGAVLDALVDVLSTFDSINPASVKAYHSVHDTWSMGKTAPLGFVHCEVALLSGRSIELRRQIASEMQSLLHGEFRDAIASGLAGVTVEVREMDADSYLK